jgi:MFS family permease
MKFLLAGSFSDRLGRKNVLLASFIVFALSYIGFANAQNVLSLAALFIFYGLYQGIFRAVGKAFASDFVPENLRASAVGWYSSVVGLLQLVASVVGGLLWDRVGHAAVFYYGAIFGLAGSIGLIVLTPKRDHPSAA